MLTSSPHANLIKHVHPQGIVELVLNRPERKNAFVNELYLALIDEITLADQQADVRVLIIRGEDDFSAGNDLNDFIENPPQDNNAPPLQLLKTAHLFSKPLIIAIKGFAVGIGVTLPLHADLVYCDANAKFKLPFLTLGLTPEGASTLLLTQRAGYLKAAELLLLGEVFDASAALEAKLVNRIIEGDVYQFALQKAQQLALLPMASLKISKALLKDTSSDVLQRINKEGDIFVETIKGPQFKEAAQAFKEKRKPDFLQFEEQ
jgi:enoyl-CoA hydratase/carnithine racemase